MMRSLWNDWRTLRAKRGSSPREKLQHGSRCQHRLSRRLRGEMLEARQMLSITVNTSIDERDFSITDGDISLRDAIEIAAGGEINFALTLNGATITLIPTLGEIAFEKDFTIDASGLSAGLTIRAADPTPTVKDDNGSRIFNITDGSNGATPPEVTMKGLTLTGADLFKNGPVGGAIRSEGLLTLIDCTFTDNHAALGGAVYIDVRPWLFGRDVLTVEDCMFENNFAGSGGAIAIRTDFYSEDDRYSISSSQFEDNHAISGTGGAISADMTGGSYLTMAETKFSVNTAPAYGGAVHVTLRESSYLTIERSEFVENTVTDHDGGGLLVRAFGGSPESEPQARAVTILESLFSGNDAPERGGGIYLQLDNPSEALIADSRITGNMAYAPHATSYGGGLYAMLRRPASPDFSDGKLIITGSTIDENSAGRGGGGVFVKGQQSGIFSCSIVNSTISGNRTLDEINGEGGGIMLSHFLHPVYDSLDAYLTNVTVTENWSARGGGISALDADMVRVRLANSIVSRNFTTEAKTTPSNLYGRFNVPDLKHNLIGSGSTVRDANGSLVLRDSPALNTIPMANNNLFNNAPQLSELADHGGPTPTHLPLVGSPVIDAGNPAVVYSATEYDQRGATYARVFDQAVDIGAVELAPVRILDVIVKGSTWGTGVEYSYAALVALALQLRPIPTQGADTIEIQFDGPVNINGGMLTLNRTVRNSNGSVTHSVPTAGNPAPYDFDYDPDTYIACWVFDSPLGDGKFAIHLSDDVTGGGNPLDGDWTNEKRIGNLLPLTPDNWHDDQPRAFAVGDGMPGSQGGEFRFHFAILVADFNGDGWVEGQDELEYTEQFVAQDRWGDANGDGAVSGADLSIWAATGPTMLPLRRKGGADINDDEIVNGVDYGIWLAGWGQTGDGDIDGDGDTDGYDFLLWQSAFGSESAWHIAMPGASQNLTSIYGPQTLVGLAAPQVLNVIISGSLSMHAPFSFDTVDGSGDQLKTVPVGGANTISIVFSEGVNITAESLFLVSLHLAVRPTLAEFSYDPLTHMATWRYEGWPLADQYLLSLSDRVTDADGNWLDGEWVNPRINWSTTAAISEFPSGDGDPGGMFNFVMTLLPGDANLDGAVNNGDYVIWQPLLGADGVFQDGDFNGDGMVTGDDAAIWSLTNGLYYQAIWVGCDLDGDLDVDDVDLQVIFDNAGMPNPTFYDGDFNFDGEVDADDLDIAMAQYGLNGLFINAVW